MLKWAELIVTNVDGDTWGTLGELVQLAPANLDGAKYDETTGAIRWWIGFFISAPDEIPTSDTPEVKVDWTGFQETLKNVG